MVRARSSWIGCALVILACSDASDRSPQAPEQRGTEASSGAGNDQLVTPPLEDGYQRYVAPVVDVPAKSSDDWAQWVGGPLDQDYDVADIRGNQSKTGHHALLYATSEANPPGFTRLWGNDDQLKTRMMGGVGGEGGAAVGTLPPGVVFRVKKGSYLVIQTHYLNGSNELRKGQSYIDVKLAPSDLSRQVASIMSSTDIAFKLLPGTETTQEFRCEVKQDLRFLQIANHMHNYGTKVSTEVTDPSGATRMIKQDEVWRYHWALSPNFETFPVANPLVIPAGSILHTRCTWNNDSADTITFPAEMCVFFGFFLGEFDVSCAGGEWSVLGGDNGTGAGDQRAMDDATVVDSAGGACLNGKDQELMNAEQFGRQSIDCSVPCAFDADVAACTARCFHGQVGLSSACAACNGKNIACGTMNCLSACAAGLANPPCRDCLSTNCDASFKACTGP